MTGEPLKQAIAAERRPQHAFIRWSDTGGVCCELLDYFIARRADTTELAAFELLDMEQMWQQLLSLGETGLSRAVRKQVEIIDWQQPGGGVRSCCFRAEGLLALYEEIQARRGAA
ncbi:MAG: hypothetical protein AB7T15_03050 [Desulfuromonas sp.]|jgi:hypothetical protein|nr:hypothetical protein [Desulfuromonas thiophila]MDY0398130.1 hypothetical protein [Desulfuromonas thiophila]